MAASDYVPNLSKYRLHPKGRPQMESGRLSPLPLELHLGGWMARYRKHGRFGLTRVSTPVDDGGLS